MEGINLSKALERRRILEYAKTTGSVKQTCLVFGISRTIFYRWQRRFEMHGIAGLEDKLPEKPVMPNQVDKVTEKAILDQIARTPKDGPRQLCYTLNHNGYTIGETGVYRVMKRHGLSRREARLAYARSCAHNRSDLRQLAKLDVKLKQVEHQIPGYLVMETVREWQPQKGYGKVYYYAIYDVHSKWGLIKMFPDKYSISIAEIYAMRIAPMMKIFNLPIKNVLSEQLPVFEDCWERRWQAEKAVGRGKRVSRIWELPESKKELMQPLDGFVDAIFSALNQAINLKIKPSANLEKIEFSEMEYLLEKCLRYYNFKQAQDGQTPTEIVLNYVEKQGVDPETLPLWVYIRMV